RRFLVLPARQEGPRTARRAALRRGLDALSRFSRPAGQDAAEPVARTPPPPPECTVTTAREQIFAALRQGYRGRNEAAAKVGVDARVARREANLVPARAKPEHKKAAVAAFTAMAEEAAATVARVNTMIDVPGAVADYLRAHNLPMRAALAPDPL